MNRDGPVKTVLIIDDDMQMRFYLMTMVKSLGATPVLARDGEEGLDKLKSLKPALIILDIMMPNKGGTLVYKHLTGDAALKKIPVVFFSGVDKEAFRHYIRMLNTRENLCVLEPESYVTKDVDPRYLKTVLERYLGPAGEDPCG